MIFRIVNADGTVAMSLDYPDATIPRMFLKEGQALFAGNEESRLHIKEDNLVLVDGVLQSSFIGPTLDPFIGEGDVLTKVEAETTVDQYIAVPMDPNHQT